MTTWTYPAVVLGWHDGDTPRLDIDLGFHVHHIRSARVYGIDAPELGCAEGLASLARAQALLPVGTKLTVVSQKLDKYGRPLVRMMLPDGRDFSTVMLEEGYAVVYPE